MRFLVSALARAVAGTHFGPDATINGATIDSRSVLAGQLFVPIVAERDGHDFIPAAIEAGAGAFLTAQPTSVDHREVPHVVVNDTARALLELGTLARAELTPPVIGITGSVGKTSTKDLIAAACGAARRTHANPDSFNNELGLPLTLLNAPAEVEVTVLEMGARGLGHINELCQVGRPTVGVVTRVALAHGEQFGSIEAVQAAKSELIQNLGVGGAAILNASDPRVLAMAERCDAPVTTYGVGVGDVAVHDLQLSGDLRPSFRLQTPAGEAAVRLKVRGAHMAENAAGAVAAALAVGVSLEEAVAGIVAAEPSSWRMEVDTSASGLTIINDAYNANPTSVAAALRGLMAIEAGRRLAILGPMAELGADSDALHRQVTEDFNAAGVTVVAIDAPAYGDGASHVGSHEQAEALLNELGPGDAVLVKGSRVAELEQLAARLLAER